MHRDIKPQNILLTFNWEAVDALDTLLFEEEKPRKRARSQSCGEETKEQPPFPDVTSLSRDETAFHRMLQNVNLKICDMGLAKMVGMDPRHTVEVITLYYRPPELLLVPSDERRGFSLCVILAYSHGCLLFHSLLQPACRCLVSRLHDR